MLKIKNVFVGFVCSIALFGCQGQVIEDNNNQMHSTDYEKAIELAQETLTLRQYFCENDICDENVDEQMRKNMEELDKLDLTDSEIEEVKEYTSQIDHYLVEGTQEEKYTVDDILSAYVKNLNESGDNASYFYDSNLASVTIIDNEISYNDYLILSLE